MWQSQVVGFETAGSIHADELLSMTGCFQLFQYQPLESLARNLQGFAWTRVAKQPSAEGSDCQDPCMAKQDSVRQDMLGRLYDPAMQHCNYLDHDQAELQCPYEASTVKLHRRTQFALKMHHRQH